jgi:hypothetical protein
MRFAVCGIGVLLALRADEIKTSLCLVNERDCGFVSADITDTTRETEAQVVSSSGCDAMHVGSQSPLTKHKFG